LLEVMLAAGVAILIYADEPTVTAGREWLGQRSVSWERRRLVAAELGSRSSSGARARRILAETPPPRRE
jgi:hypothetical protein